MAASSDTSSLSKASGSWTFVLSGEKEVVNMKKMINRKAISAIEAVGTVGGIFRT
jgi:hypothetical protein